MISSAEISPNGGSLTVRMSLTFRKHGGRKRVVAPDEIGGVDLLRRGQLAHIGERAGF